MPLAGYRIWIFVWSIFFFFVCTLFPPLLVKMPRCKISLQMTFYFTQMSQAWTDSRKKSIDIWYQNHKNMISRPTYFYENKKKIKIVLLLVLPFSDYCQTILWIYYLVSNVFRDFSPTSTYSRQLCSFPSRLIKNEVLGKPENEIKMTFSQNCV